MMCRLHKKEVAFPWKFIFEAHSQYLEMYRVL